VLRSCRLSWRQKKRQREKRYWQNVCVNTRKWLDRLHARREREDEAVFKEVCLVDALGRIATRSPTLLMGLSWPLLRGTNSCANGRALALIYYLEHFALYRFLTVNPTFFLNTCFTAARPKLRRSVARVVRINKHNDGQYILCYNKHFVAFRILDGDAEINFTHKSHAWRKCWVSSCVTKPVEFHANLGAYVVDESLLDGLFQICSACHCSSSTAQQVLEEAPARPLRWRLA